MSFTPFTRHLVLGSIVVSIPACHAGDRGSIPRRGEIFFFFFISKFHSTFRRFLSRMKTV